MGENDLSVRYLNIKKDFKRVKSIMQIEAFERDKDFCVKLFNLAEKQNTLLSVSVYIRV